MRRRWVVAKIDGALLYFWNDFVLGGHRDAALTQTQIDRLMTLASGALTSQIAKEGGLSAFVFEDGFVVMTYAADRPTFELKQKADALALAGKWGLPVEKLAANPPPPPIGVRRFWVIAKVKGEAINFFYDVYVNAGSMARN